MKEKIQSYRELVVWQKSMNLVDDIYEVTREFPKNELFGLVSQMRRSAVSVPANIAEGRHRSSRSDFLRFLSIAHASLMELETHCDIALRQRFLEKGVYDRLMQETAEVSRMLYAMMKKLRATS